MNSRKIYNQFNSILKNANQKNYQIKKCLRLLKDDYKEILENSFFKRIYDYWWVDCYSVTNYYRKRFRAIRSFVCLFNVMNETN